MKHTAHFSLPMEHYFPRNFAILFNVVMSFFVTVVGVAFLGEYSETHELMIGIFGVFMTLAFGFLFIVSSKIVIKPPRLFRITEEGFTIQRYPHLVRWEEIEEIKMIHNEISSYMEYQMNGLRPMWIGLYLKNTPDLRSNVSRYMRWTTRSNIKYFGTPAVLRCPGRHLDANQLAAWLEAHLRTTRKPA